jgi:hypothetical protein
MKKIYALFNDQEGAGNAIEALAAAGLEDADIHEIEESDTNLETETVIVAPLHQSGYGAATPLPFPTFLTDIGDGETRDFIHRSLEGGAALVVLETKNEDDYNQARAILEREGGQITS